MAPAIEPERAQVVGAVHRALRRESHTLSRRPELIWQQLHNRLHATHPLLDDLLIAERSRRDTPWIRTHTRLRESEALRYTLAGHGGSVQDCAISPDGAWIVSAGSDSTLKVWDSGTGREIHTLQGHTGPVHSCAVGPRGEQIVSAGADGTLRVWDPGTGAEIRTLEGHGWRRGVAWSYRNVMDCAISPDGAWIVSAGKDSTLKVWDSGTGREVRSLAGHTNGVSSCAFSPDGTRMISGGKDQKAAEWDRASGRRLREFSGHQLDRVLHPTILGSVTTPDGKRLVTSSEDNSVKVWDLATGEVLLDLLHETDGAFVFALTSGVAVSPDGEWIVSGLWDGTLQLWNLASGDRIATLAGHTGPVLACAVASSGRWIVSASGDGTLKVWDTVEALKGRLPTGHTGSILSCVISPDGDWVGSVAEDQSLRIWDIATGTEIRTVTDDSSDLDCDVGPDGKWIVSAGREGVLKIWDVDTGRQTKTLSGRRLRERAHIGHATGCSVSPDGSWIASVGSHGKLVVWNTARGRVIYELRHPTAHDVSISPDGSCIVTANSDGTLTILDAISGETIQTLAGHSDRLPGVHRGGSPGDSNKGALACAVSPDGALIASGGDDGTVRIWDARSGTEVRAFTGHAGTVQACAFSPDGALIVSGSSDATLRVWDADTGRQRGLLVVPGAINTVAVHPTRPLVAAGDEGGNLHLAHLCAVDFGPLVVAAEPRGRKLTVRCRVCGNTSRISEDQIGGTMACADPGCETPLRLAPFVLQTVRPKRRGNSQ